MKEYWKKLKWNFTNNPEGFMVESFWINVTHLAAFIILIILILTQR